jgi:hypothetical protein
MRSEILLENGKLFKVFIGCGNDLDDGLAIVYGAATVTEEAMRLLGQWRCWLGQCGG